MQFLARVLAYPQQFLAPFDALGGARTLVDTARVCLEARHAEQALAPRVRGGGKGVAKATAHAMRNYLRTHLLVASHQLQHTTKSAAPAAGPSSAGGFATVSPLHSLHGGGAAGAGGGVRLVQPEAEEQVAIACVVVERRGRLFDAQSLAEAVHQLVAYGAIEVAT